LDQAGRPFLISLARLPTGLLAFDWVDSAWVQRWQFGQGTVQLFPVQAPPGQHHLVWRGVGPVAEERMFFAQVLANGVQEPETVTTTLLSNEYSGTVSAKRRWVALTDFVGGQRVLRVLYSDTAATWREASIPGRSQYVEGVAIATTGDSTALLAWEEGFGLHWGTLDDTQWTEGPPFSERVTRMQFRRRPSGGQWLASGTDRPHVALMSYREGAWSPPESLQCAYRDGLPNHRSGTPDLSRDDGEYPVIVWDAQDIRALATICVCVPTESGYGVAEELQGVAINGGLPTVARDRNGDVWVAWSVFAGDVWWIHSYGRATAIPRIEGHGINRRVAWTLSQSAPETWWAVLRARGSGDFEEVARVRAGPGLEMSWNDTSPPARQLRYKIRRESVDASYLWESAEVRLPKGGRGMIVEFLGRLPIERRGVLQVANAAPGPMELRFFDVQGRMVHLQHGTSDGAGHDTFDFDLATSQSPPPNGVYFATVRDASGQVSPAVRLVVLR
jgi:hypothetical protein